MANDPRDANQKTALMGVLSTTGTSVALAKANPTTHKLKVSDDVTGTDFGPTRALRDDNQVTSIVATSSVDGVTPVVVYVDGSGNLLIDSA